MKYKVHYALSLDTVRDLRERLAKIQIPDYLRDTCELGLDEAEILLTQWQQSPSTLANADEYQFLDQVMRRIGFVDDMTRDLVDTEESAS